jgi:membrane-bound lytic murein transglycosylase B
MSLGVRQATRLCAVVAATMLPMATGSFAQSTVPAAALSRAGAHTDVSPAPWPSANRFDSFPAPQQIEPVTVIQARLSAKDKHRKITVSGPRGTHEWTVSGLAEHDVPQAAMRAYKNAAADLHQTDPGCGIPWTLLAGIGRVESNHGRYGGSVLASDGVSRPAIIGIALDGAGPVAAIPDTDNGHFDHDKVWDRAVGPMQFIPSTWKYAGRDGDHNGVMNPDDIDDAALAAAAYLCSGSGSMASEASMRAAIFRYNPSDYYVALVMAFERGYRTGVFEIPSPPPPPAAPAKHHKHKAAPKTASTTKSSAPVRHHATTTTSPQPSPKPSAKPSPKPSATTSPKPSTSPSPSPTAPALVTLTGTLTTCASGWCVDGTAVDLGSDSQLGRTAANDYDGDGSVESNSAELNGLAALGQQVSLQVGKGTAPAVVYTINTKNYRNGDGTYP